MLRPRALSPFTIAMILAACAAEPASDPLDPARDDTEATLDTDATAQASTASDSATPAAGAGCSVVTTCNAAGSDGTRCRQQPGCSVGAAQLECELEAFVVCGAIICPVILIHTDGTRENLCAGDRP